MVNLNTNQLSHELKRFYSCEGSDVEGSDVEGSDSRIRRAHYDTKCVKNVVYLRPSLIPTVLCLAGGHPWTSLAAYQG
jgi:hypothetical protein